MGQTLTHGVYLPDEGERNCYSGLAGNWTILDGAVGTVAEHTTQIAGKAPLVHTHTKSDVTDLLNSDFIPSANNSYNLGSSSYQWNNIYSKGYYYNGVAWGLDKSNVWSANNEYKYLIGLSGAEIWFKQPNIEDVTANPDANISKSIIQIYNKTVTQYSGGIADSLRTDGSHRLVISCFGFPLNNYAGYYPHTFYFEAKRDGTASFSPSYTNASLGTSTNRWKTLNGIFPGALSLPAAVYSDIDTTNWTLTGSTINYTPVLDGWVEINLNANASSFTRISVENAYYRHSSESQAGNQAMLTFPVRANQTYGIKLWGSSILQARFIKCEGNV